MSEKSIWADDIVRSPEKVEEIKSKYCVLCDRTVTGGKFDNMNRAINIMAEKGWRCISMTTTGTSLYVLMEKI